MAAALATEVRTGLTLEPELDSLGGGDDDAESVTLPLDIPT
jgi:hypothetical protein